MEVQHLWPGRTGYELDREAIFKGRTGGITPDMLDLARNSTCDPEIRSDLLSPRAIGFLKAFGARSEALPGADRGEATQDAQDGVDLLWGTVPLTQLRGNRVRRLGSHKVHESWVVGVYKS